MIALKSNHYKQKIRGLFVVKKEKIISVYYAFMRCVDVMSRLIEKYADEIETQEKQKLKKKGTYANKK